MIKRRRECEFAARFKAVGSVVERGERGRGPSQIAGCVEVMGLNTYKFNSYFLKNFILMSYGS